MSRWTPLLLGVWLIGCPGRHGIEALPGSPASVVAAARARPVPDPLKARFGVKLRSKPLDLAASTGGGLMVDRPGRGRVDLFGPMGGPLYTVSSDGAALAVMMVSAKRNLVAADAELVIREATGGAASLDDAFAMLTGDIPFDEAEAKDITEAAADDLMHAGQVHARLDGPKGVTVGLWVESASATVREIEAFDRKGNSLVRATYDPYQAVGDALMPSRVELYVPTLDLTVTVTYKSWEVLAEPPSPLVPTVPEGFATEPLEEALRNLSLPGSSAESAPSP